MKNIVKIGLSACCGIALGLLWAYKNNDEDEFYKVISDNKNVKKIITNDNQDSYNKAKRPIKPSPTPVPVKKPLVRIKGIRNTSKKRQPVQNWNTLLKGYHSTQITISNSSSAEKAITLWGTDDKQSISPPAPDEVEDHTITKTVTIPKAIGTGVHPQGIAVNPVNGFAYVANQLSNNVSVIAPSGQVVALIPLQPSTFPGYNSPVAVAVNTKTDSVNYGKTYVVGSVANTVSVIDLTHHVIKEISVGIRPVAIAFNPINEKLYVANLVDNSLSVIDTTTETVSTSLPVGENPFGVGINLKNGDVFVTNSQDDSISVFNADDTLATTILAVANNPVSIVYHPINNAMYVVASNSIIPIDAELYTASAPIDVGENPYSILFNPNNNFLYVGNKGDNTYTLINLDNKIIATLALGNVNIGLGLHQKENVLFSSNTNANTINIIGYHEQSSNITINDDFWEKKNAFQHQPAQVKHLKVIVSGSKSFSKTLTLREKTMTGTLVNTSISLNNYDSPQNFQNVYEISTVDGAVIDGLNSWLFTIGGKQNIVLMIYYKKILFNQLSKTQLL